MRVYAIARAHNEAGGARFCLGGGEMYVRVCCVVGFCMVCVDTYDDRDFRRRKVPPEKDTGDVCIRMI